MTGSEHAMAVVWREGTAILVKGFSTAGKVDLAYKNAVLRSYLDPGIHYFFQRFCRYLWERRNKSEASIAWHEHWTKKWQQANADYDSEARLRINRMLAEQLGVQLVFIPSDSRDVQILVDA